MKVKINESKEIKEDYVVINCSEITPFIHKIVNVIENIDQSISAKLNNEMYRIALSDIYYFEAVENHVFAYTEKQVFEVSYKIQELIDLFIKSSFLQTSRTVVLNIEKIEKVSSLINGRIMAVLQNGEKMIITRAYAQNFRQKLKE